MFRFTIRDVLWLTVVVALTVGWWVDRTMLKDMTRYLERTWVEHIQREHPGQAEYERLMGELITGFSN